jgi:hypothetical protein
MLGIRGQYYRPHGVGSRRSVPALLLNIGIVPSSWLFFVLDFFATSRPRTTTTTSTIRRLARLPRDRLRARFLRHLQIEDDDDHEHDQRFESLPPLLSSRRKAGTLHLLLRRKAGTLRLLGRDFDVILGRDVLRKKDILLTIPNVTMEQHL